MKHDMRKRDRAIRDVAKPFVHHSTKGCQLHVKVGERDRTPNEKSNCSGVYR